MLIGDTDKLSHLAALVQVSGSDPKLAKAHARPFHTAANGVTTLSASGIVLTRDEGAPIIVCPANLLVPFLPSHLRNALASASHASLLPGTRISVSTDYSTLNGHAAVEGRLRRFFCISSVAAILTRLTPNGGDWSAKWLLGDAKEQGQGSLLPWMAVLDFPFAPIPVARPLGLVAFSKGDLGSAMLPGSTITAMGSPFGALSHAHFKNHIAAGIVANAVYAQDGSQALLLADMHVLPGMDGGPVIDCEGKLVGVLGLPLSSHTFRAEVPTIIPAGCLIAILRTWQASTSASASSMSLPENSKPAEWQAKSGGRRSQNLSPRLPHIEGRSPPCGAPAPGTATTGGTSSGSNSFPALTAAVCAAQSQPKQLQPSLQRTAAAQGLQHAVTSAQPGVVAVSTNGGTWASGVVVSARNGYIVTNAHLLVERTAGSGRSSQEDSRAASAERVPPTLRVQVWQKDGGSAGGPPRPVSATAAVVFVFQGALDIAVLQLEGRARVHLQQLALRDSGQTPSTAAGEPVAVVAFPLFSPRFCLGHIATAGVVSKVVYSEGDDGERQAGILMTNAAIQPGASGGAVIGLDGCMVGLVTSNARHSKTDRLLPKLNFSLPAEALQPLWRLLLSPAPVSTADLEKLDVHTDVLASMWDLSSPPAGDQKLPSGASRLQDLLQQRGIVETGRNNTNVDSIRSRL